ncbi:MAG: hypothetical protein ICV60_10605 [Pyrinomonadaceae bacterium]|nr:hypothetical protein [Pyrinomonadaceae bacterium]
MSQPKCSCSSFERFEGASVPAYTKAFLEPADERDAPQKNRFRCRICGRMWERRAPSQEAARPSLVRM